MTSLPAPSPATRAVAERITIAHSAREPLRIAGAGTWLDAGRPVVSRSTISLGAGRGIIEYVPGDLTMTVSASARLSEISTALAAERQWLPLDPAGTDAGTIGATVATNSAGPLAHAFGAPRDQVLGLEFVDGRGIVARGGGRVVKNVAGFDLTRLLIGSWGTLGVITEVSMRLRAHPETDTTIAIALPAGDEALKSVLARLATAPIAPFALEMVNNALARRLGLGEGPLLLARLGGNAELVKAQRGVLETFGEVKSDVDAVAWRAIRECDAGNAIVMRISRRRSHMATTWRHACDIARGAKGFVHASPGRGIARIALPGAGDVADLKGELARFGGSVTFERLSASLWPALTRGDSAHPLAAGVKAAFDPDHILNPGILGESAA